MLLHSPQDCLSEASALEVDKLLDVFEADPDAFKKELKEAFRDPQLFLEALCLHPEQVGGLPGALDFPLRVPRSWLDRIEKGNPRDPLFLQLWSSVQEQVPVSGYVQDPLEEKNYRVSHGLIHKYQGRVLWSLTGACALHCRYCFRRHFPYQEHPLSPEGLGEVQAYLGDHPEIEELILSGGDPLSCSDLVLKKSIEAVYRPQLKTLRYHTRFPVAIPSRLMRAWVRGLMDLPMRVVIILHINHPQELLDETLCRRLRALKKLGIDLFSQTVLLSGVNDDVAVLQDLSHRLWDNGVLPYYLHQLDRVEGAAHFEVSEDRARALIRDLAKRLPGYLMPRWVREIPGRAYKQPLDY